MNFQTISYRLLGCSLFFIASCTDKGNKYDFNEVGWTISVPGDLELMDEPSLTAMNDLGKMIIENGNDTMANSNSKTLFCIKGDNLNYLSASITPITAEYIEGFKKGNRAQKDFMYTTMKAQMQGASVDTVSSLENINSKSFDRFDLDISFPYKGTMNIQLYSAIISDYELGITIAYVDKNMGKKFASIIHRSTFR
jgi:hypothetical protein